jgi:serine/threonine protein phosphatase PrpC
MMLWIIAAIACAVLLAALAFLVLRRDDDARWQAPRHGHPWDRRAEEPDGTRMATMPPPAAGVPIPPTLSEEADRFGLESQELWIEEDEEPTGPVPKIVLSAAGMSDPGRKREHNEDAYLVWPEHEVYAIADGMGGYAAGEVASQLAVDILRESFLSGGAQRALEEGFPRRGAELMAAIQVANERIREEASRDEAKNGMGTTLVAARFSPGRKRAYIAHVGDSRCYRIRDGEIKQLTVDHTLGAVGIQGPAADKLSRAVGVFDHVDVDLTIDEPSPGDLYLLCSDGLYKMLSDQMILQIVQSPGSLDQIVDQLIRGANERGGRDNVSVVLVHVDDPDVDPRESGEHRIPG